jgi:hypothetical protein
MKRKIGEPKVSVKHRLRMLEGASMIMQKQMEELYVKFEVFNKELLEPLRQLQGSESKKK